jgi:glycopeptide antibiotics resistance protein
MTLRPGREHRLGRAEYALLALAWALFLAYGSLVPLDFERVSLNDALALFRQAISFPMVIDSRTDFVTNILLAVPLGYTLIAALRTDRRGWAGRLGSALLTVVASLAVAVVVEFTQTFLPDRSPSFSDVVAQGFGAVVGTIAWLAAGDAVTSWLRETLAERERPAFVQRALLAYCVVFAISQVMPLDLTISLGELAGKYRAGGIVIVPFTWTYASQIDRLWDLAGDILLNVPIGAAAVLTGTTEGVRRRPLRAAAFGIAIVAAIEFLQVFVHSRVADATDVITGSAGVVLGVMAATRLSQRSASQSTRPEESRAVLWAKAGVLVWFALLASYHWNPFDFTTDAARVTIGMHQLVSVPFYSYYIGTEFHAFTEMSRKTLLAVPLGVLLRLCERSGGPVPALMKSSVQAAVGLILLLAIELGQVFLPTRIPDSTDVLMGEIGVLAGMWLTTRVMTLQLRTEPVPDGPPPRLHS